MSNAHYSWISHFDISRSAPRISLRWLVLHICPNFGELNYATAKQVSRPVTGNCDPEVKAPLELGARPTQVLYWLAKGKANKEIGIILGELLYPRLPKARTGITALWLKPTPLALPLGLHHCPSLLVSRQPLPLLQQGRSVMLLELQSRSGFRFTFILNPLTTSA